ncbi:hypothetical protein [Tateyamaria sp.]
MKRLKFLLLEQTPVLEQKAVLGLVEQPKLSMMEGFERFWDYIEDACH